MRRRKASLHITLVLIGAASLANCAKPPEIRRDEYAKLEDCLADWDNNPDHCKVEIAQKDAAGVAPSTGTSSSRSSFYPRYYGPSYDYYSDGRRDYGRASGIGSSRSTTSGSTSSGSSSRLGSGRSIGSHSLPSHSSSSSSSSRGGFGSSASAHSSGG